MKAKKITKLFFIVCFFLMFQAEPICSQTFVEWNTSMGVFRVQLREDLVPVTAQNFIDLTNAGFYNGLIFHRVIAGFMNQDGCPNGTGTGGPGYTFDDEFHPDLRHDEAGIISMANSGPNTNGSQYFITVAPTDWLDDLHAVFGKITDGLDVVIDISEVETDMNDKPLVDVVINTITVVTGDPLLSLTAPLDGDIFVNNKENFITWSSDFVADVILEYSIDDGASWNTIDTVSANRRTYAWVVPDVLTTTAKVRITDLAHNEIIDMTENTFSIASLSLITPEGGGKIQCGHETEVTWTSDFIENINVEFSGDKGDNWSTIAENIPASTGSYTWTVPADTTTNSCYVRISVSNYPNASDMNNSFIMICKLDLLSPVNSDVLRMGTLHSITWEDMYIPKIDILYSIDDGTNWIEIENDVSTGPEEYEWTVPSNYSEQCKLRIVSSVEDYIYGINEGSFIIDYPINVEQNLVNKEFTLNCISKPGAENIIIKYTIPEAYNDNIKLRIFNVEGKLIRELVNRNHNSGSYEISFNAKDLRSGVYYCKLEAGNTSISEKILIVK